MQKPRGKIADNLFNIIPEKARNYIRKYHHILIAAGFSDRACEAFDLLSHRELIKIRPIEIIAAVYDGLVVDQEGWISTEVYPTADAKKYHKQDIDKKVLSFIGHTQ